MRTASVKAIACAMLPASKTTARIIHRTILLQAPAQNPATFFEIGAKQPQLEHVGLQHQPSVETVTTPY
jgi:hypothetical protein